MKLSVIIPAYNEADSLFNTLNSVEGYLSNTWLESWQVIVVNDGSTDQTKQLLKNINKLWLKVINLPVNKGKGAALIAGSQAADGDILLWMDADSSTAIQELSFMLPYLNTADVIFGSRALTKSQIAIHQPWFREILGKFGNLVIQLLLLPGIKDSQCGFKLLGPQAKVLVNQLHTQGWGIDVELLVLAKSSGLRLQEVPVRWKHDPSSAIRPASYLITLGEVLKIFWRLKIKRNYERSK